MEDDSPRFPSIGGRMSRGGGLVRYAEWQPSVPRRWEDSRALLPAAFVAAWLLLYFVPFIGCLSFPGAGAAMGWVRGWQIRSRLALLRDLPAPIDQIPVRLRLSRVHAYADEVGLLSLVERWLVFEGERTSFSLSNVDVTPDAKGFGFAFDGPNGTHYATFEPIRERELSDPWSLWVAAPPPADRAVVLPPTQPLAVSTGRSYFLGAGAWILFAAFCAADLGARGYWVSALVIAFVSTLGVSALFMYSRSIATEHRRLGRGLPPARRHGVLGAAAPVRYVRWRAGWGWNRLRRRRRR